MSQKVLRGWWLWLEDLENTKKEKVSEIAFLLFHKEKIMAAIFG